VRGGRLTIWEGERSRARSSSRPSAIRHRNFVQLAGLLEGHVVGTEQHRRNVIIVDRAEKVALRVACARSWHGAYPATFCLAAIFLELSERLEMKGHSL